MRFSGIFQTISFTVRKRFVNAFLPSPYTVSKPSKNAPKTAKKIRNACGKNPHPLPPSCGSQSPKNRFVRPFFGILQVLALKTPARWPFSHSLCVFTPRQPRRTEHVYFIIAQTHWNGKRQSHTPRAHAANFPLLQVLAVKIEHASIVRRGTRPYNKADRPGQHQI